MTLALDNYLDLIGDGDEDGAIEVVTGLLDAGVPPQRIMVDLIGGAQAKVGELWAANEWTVAREHAATATSERALAAVAARCRTARGVPPAALRAGLHGVRHQLRDFPASVALLDAGLAGL